MIDDGEILDNVGPPKDTIAKLVNITSITRLYDTQITSNNYGIHGVYRPTYNWGGRHCNRAHPTLGHSVWGSNLDQKRLYKEGPPITLGNFVYDQKY
jgi:hypothetical protein